jgi:transcriptional adapter 3
LFYRKAASCLLTINQGDRTTPFIMPPRGKKHYTEIWAEEDGLMNVDQANGDRERLPLNQGRGSIDQVTDETVETDKVSVGPLVSRLYSLLRYEHRADPDENSTTGAANGEPSTSNFFNGDSMDIDQPAGESDTKPLPSATSFPDASPSGFKVPAAKLDHAQLDERLKAELRHIGFLGEDDNPDYDAHYDDDIAQRLRLLQSELKKQMVTNNARKARLLEIARERMAYQEYTTIHDDLDSQVQQAYLKRTRTLGKSKKGSQAKHRPGGAGGGSHVASGAGVSRPAIGDVARTLMDRRKRWEECIGPIFKDSKTSVPGKGETIFDPAVMAEYEKAELEGWDEEQE